MNRGAVVLLLAIAGTACSGEKERKFVCPDLSCGLPDAAIDTTPADDSAPADTSMGGAAETFDPSCVDGPSPASGSVLVAAAIDDFVPLCSGHILYGNKTASQIVLASVISGASIRNYPLTAAPVELAYDAPNKTLWIAHAATKASRLDLVTGMVTEITLPATASSIALGPAGKVLVFTTTSDGSQVHVVDAASATIAKSFDLARDVDRSKIAWDGTNSQLFFMHRALSPSEIHRYAFDVAALTLTKTESVRDCSNGIDLAVSSDGKHLGVACGGGNLGYVIWDFDPTNLTMHSGEWATGAYPSGAAFSANGIWFGSNDTREMQLFDVATHAKSPTTYTPKLCDYGSLSRTQFSRGSKLLIAHSDCGFDKDSSQFTWLRVP